MARKLRVQFEGAMYHVTARGVEKRPIFNDTRDREHFLSRLSDGVEEYSVRLYLFCLMPNHFHLLVETPKGNLSAFMHKILTAHTVFYNLRHQRVGHLFQGRFMAKLVQGDAYLNRLSRYVHLNPAHTEYAVQKPLCERLHMLRKYKWSSFRGYAGLDENWEFVDSAPLLSLFGTDDDSNRRELYRKYVEAGLTETDTAFLRMLGDSTWGIGDDSFHATVQDKYRERVLNAHRLEDVSFRRTSPNMDNGKIVRFVATALGIKEVELTRRKRNCWTRAIAARMLIKYGGLTQRETAAWLNVGSGAAICQQLAALRKALETEPDLAERVKKVERLLAAHVDVKQS